MKLSTGHNGGTRFEAKLIDAHIHLLDAKHLKNTGALVSDADSACIVPLVFNSMDCKTSLGSLILAEEYHTIVYPALCIHPWKIDIRKENELKKTLYTIGLASFLV